MIEEVEMLRQATSVLKDVLASLDTDSTLAGPAVHVQWAIDLLLEKADATLMGPLVDGLSPIRHN